MPYEIKLPLLSLVLPSFLQELWGGLLMDMVRVELMFVLGGVFNGDLNEICLGLLMNGMWCGF